VWHDRRVRLEAPALVVLIGPSGAGKSTWAARAFAAGEIVSSDRLRAVVGEAEDDLAASADAFALLDAIVDARLRRGLTAVVDTLGLDPVRRRGWVAQAARHGVPAVALLFDTPPATCRAWNAARPRPVPVAVLADQQRTFRAARDEVPTEGFTEVHTVVPERVGTAGGAAAAAVGAPAAAASRGTARLRFGLSLSRFDWPGGAAGLRDGIRQVAADAEAAGFESIWLMDHVRQIPQVGRAWEDLPEVMTTLGYLAACTSAVRLGALVAGITYRNVAHLGRIVATLDVLSGGRAMCGIGAAWFEEEHRAFGWPFPPVRERLDLVADALELLPLLWGPGAPAFRGRVLDVPEAVSYPRPLQERVPIVVGGQGERRTLRLVAERADGCNLFGDPARVRAKLAVLHAHCADVGRDPATIEVTHLSTALAAPSPDAVARLVAELRPGRTPPSRYAASVRAGTVAQQVERYAALADAGVQTAIVRVADAGRLPDALERFAAVIAAFR
jgi:alkanesulfonate monooxygenase SsuD/methylene tetrahydromethanopterin reductase-like flavin-dependent oxidoreductase (luciferase family)/predicted kinase